jgi:hypothetical protein
MFKAEADFSQSQHGAAVEASAGGSITGYGQRGPSGIVGAWRVFLN